MAVPTIEPTGREQTLETDEIIVSKTDLKGVITYANDVFLRVAGWTEDDIVGEAHNCIRHPDMPRCVFQLLWDTLATGEEIFAYVLNLTKRGDHYWVLAHVTPRRSARSPGSAARPPWATSSRAPPAPPTWARSAPRCAA